MQYIYVCGKNAHTDYINIYASTLPEQRDKALQYRRRFIAIRRVFLLTCAFMKRKDMQMRHFRRLICNISN